jgi:hypothetical protein
MRRPLAPLLLAALVLGAHLPASAAVLPVSATGLLADAAILRREYEALHPGLYRYNTPAQMDANFAQLNAALARSATLQDAFIAFTRFTATLRCGNSYPNFYNQPDDIARALFNGRNRVPFYFEWIDRKMIVTRNFTQDPRLAPGSEVLSIDATPSSGILAALLPLARAEGANDAKRIAEMGVRGDDRYEAFDIYFPMLFPPRSDAFRLRVRGAGRNESSFEVAALTYEQRIAPIAAKLAASHGGSAPLWSLRFLSPQAALLAMPTWDVYDTKWDWKAFLADAFAQLDARRPARLVIDLRENEGGSDVGRVLSAHLAGTPLPLGAYLRLVRYHSVPPGLLPYLSTWDPSFEDWGDAAAPYDARFFRLAANGEDDGGAPIVPAAPRFRGAVFVLVDASNSSATFNFEAAAQRSRLATLVGEPTGGNQRGINGGAFFFIHLPSSHIEVDLPLIGTFSAQPRPDAGLTPDIAVALTPQDVASGADPVLAAALAATP